MHVFIRRIYCPCLADISVSVVISAAFHYNRQKQSLGQERSIMVWENGHMIFAVICVAAIIVGIVVAKRAGRKDERDYFIDFPNS